MTRTWLAPLLAALLAAGLLAGTAGCSSGDAPAAAPRSRATATLSPASATGASRTPSAPPTETLAPLLQKALPGIKGKTFTSAVVTFPPGARAVPHQHGDAFVYAYVLEGTVRSRLAGEPAHTYRQGDDWTEQPHADHLVTENLSGTA